MGQFDDEQDVEGHKLIRKNLKADDEQDVEGHRMLKNRIRGE